MSDDRKFWKVERREATLVAVLDRPEARNALNIECWQQLDGLLGQADADPEICAMIIAGGPQAFSAGGDMKNVQGRGDGMFKDAYRLHYLQSVLTRLAASPVPVLAAVEGPAVGVGWSLALTCDFLVAGSSAQFAAPFGERSLVPDGAIAFHLVRGAGRLAATEIMISGRKLSAAEALNYGMASEVVDAGNALDRALEIAQAFANRSRDTTTLVLRAIRRAEEVGYRAYLDAEYELAALNLHNPAVAASRMSFKTGRKDGEK